MLLLVYILKMFSRIVLSLILVLLLLKKVFVVFFHSKPAFLSGGCYLPCNCTILRPCHYLHYLGPVLLGNPMDTRNKEPHHRSQQMPNLYIDEDGHRWDSHSSFGRHPVRTLFGTQPISVSRVKTTEKSPTGKNPENDGFDRVQKKTTAVQWPAGVSVDPRLWWDGESFRAVDLVDDVQFGPKCGRVSAKWCFWDFFPTIRTRGKREKRCLS